MVTELPQVPKDKGTNILVAIPCHNTESSIARVVAKARKYANRVVVIDDGSIDDTACQAREAGAIVVNHAHNLGYGGAIKSCFEAGKENKADILVIIDGDGQHEPDEIPRLLGPVIQGEADLTIGSRFRGNGVAIPPYRKLGIKVITQLFNLGSRVKVTDAQSGFRAYSRKIFNSFTLSENGMSISIETLEEARRKGAIIREVPIICFYAPSRLNLDAVRHGLSVAISVVKIRLQSLFPRKLSWVGKARDEDSKRV